MHYSSSNTTKIKYPYIISKFITCFVTAVTYILTNNFIVWTWASLASDCLSDIWASSIRPAKDRLPQTNFSERSQKCGFGTASHAWGISQTKEREREKKKEKPVMLHTKRRAVCHHLFDCQLIFTTVY